jgi:hypothetical protein
VHAAASEIWRTHCSNHDEIQLIRVFAKSEDLWTNRIAIVSSFALVKQNNLQLATELGEDFLNHSGCPGNPASGWM